MHPEARLGRQITGPFRRSVIEEIDVPRVFVQSDNLFPLFHCRATSIPVMQSAGVRDEASRDADIFFCRAFFRHPHYIGSQRAIRLLCKQRLLDPRGPSETCASRWRNQHHHSHHPAVGVESRPEFLRQRSQCCVGAICARRLTRQKGCRQYNPGTMYSVIHWFYPMNKTAAATQTIAANQSAFRVNRPMRVGHATPWRFGPVVRCARQKP